MPPLYSKEPTHKKCAGSFEYGINEGAAGLAPTAKPNFTYSSAVPWNSMSENRIFWSLVAPKAAH